MRGYLTASAAAAATAACRCGPFDLALQLLEQHDSLRQLVNSMTSRVVPLGQAVDAMQHAQCQGVLKVQLQCCA